MLEYGENIPLFPLNVVLFPGMMLPLHIFEERYKFMIGECLKQRNECQPLFDRQRDNSQQGLGLSSRCIARVPLSSQESSKSGKASHGSTRKFS